MAAGLVVDDAIVVLENIRRHLEHGLPPRRAALRGVSEVGFTLVAMTLALAALAAVIALNVVLYQRLPRASCRPRTAASYWASARR